MNFYRFSIAWSRVLPTGDIANINEKGIEYYDKLINKLIENNVEPMIAMYHFDLPNHLQQLGGFANSIIVTYFKDYANLLFKRFGDRVKYWITLNEPAEFCVQGYGTDHHAPAVNLNGIGEYLCVHNALKAHAMVFHLYKSQYYDRFRGKVGISLDTQFYYSDINDTDAVNHAMQFSVCVNVCI